LVDDARLVDFLLERHPTQHSVYGDRELREYVMDVKNRHMKKSSPLSKIIYDDKIHVIHNALGLHTYVSRVQGGKLKSKHELRVSTLFKKASDTMLSMIVVHELAHLKEREHNKAFYRLCEHMLPNYHQVEFETRLYLLLLEMEQSLY
jgi:predicted metal-dependent hydrolase